MQHNVSCPIAAPDQAGYMPKRKEFETVCENELIRLFGFSFLTSSCYVGHSQEWNNDAECLIADIVLEDEDDDEIRGFLSPPPRGGICAGGGHCVLTTRRCDVCVRMVHPWVDLKGSALEVYNRRLDERLYRRAFVIENDLVEQKKVRSV